MDLFYGGLREVVRVHSAGELIPIESGENLGLNRALIEGIVKATCGTRWATSVRGWMSGYAPIPE